MKSILEHLVRPILQGFYWLCQKLPWDVRMWLAHNLPSWPDVFVPGAFFVNRMDDVDPAAVRYTPPPLNIIVLQERAYLKGTVERVEVRPKDASWNHETFLLRTSNIVGNAFNLSPFLIECEGPVGSPLPKVGDAIAVFGTFGINLANGWTEIHWLQAWKAMR